MFSQKFLESICFIVEPLVLKQFKTEFIELYRTILPTLGTAVLDFI